MVGAISFDFSDNFTVVIDVISILVELFIILVKSFQSVIPHTIMIARKSKLTIVIKMIVIIAYIFTSFDFL